MVAPENSREKCRTRGWGCTGSKEKGTSNGRRQGGERGLHTGCCTPEAFGSWTAADSWLCKIYGWWFIFLCALFTFYVANKCFKREKVNWGPIELIIILHNRFHCHQVTKCAIYIQDMKVCRNKSKFFFAFWRKWEIKQIKLKKKIVMFSNLIQKHTNIFLNVHCAGRFISEEVWIQSCVWIWWEWRNV